MKRRSIFAILCVALVVLLVLSMGKSGKADYPPGNWKCAQKESVEAGKLFYQALSELYISLMYLEQRDDYKANNIRNGATLKLDGAKQIYETIERMAPDREIALSEVISGKNLELIKREFGELNVPFPKTWKGLAKKNKEEIQDFKTFLEKAKYSSDPNENRILIKRMNEAIFRIMSIGLSISEIATKCP